jgi:MtN3 and saliva related transmembrane protein
MLSLESVIGFTAAICTAAANLPQVIKAWRTRSVGDLSLRMILLLGSGLTLWIVYGLMKADLVIIIANAASLALVAILLFFKVRERRGGAGLDRRVLKP